MKVLLIGSGAREVALARKINSSQLETKLFCWPSSASLARLTDSVPSSVDGLDSLADWAAEQKIEVAVVGPEKPLVDGICEKLSAKNIPVFGPNAKAAQLEGSKSFAKDVMGAAGVPTAAYVTVQNRKDCEAEAFKMLTEHGGCVLKASGLAGGKGVFVCFSKEDVNAGLDRLYGGMAGAAQTVVVEQVLEGRECSFFVMLGASDPSVLGFAVDFKRLNDGDRGPNTGGMGCYTPVPWLPADAADQVLEKVVRPTVAELSRRGIDYTGFLYVGLMWGAGGPQVVEFNVRFGDPECQIMAVADDRDWFSLILNQLGLGAVSDEGRLKPFSEFRKTVGVVLTSNAYPYGEVENISSDITEVVAADDGAIFGASISHKDGKYYNGSGRVMTVVGSGDSFDEARKQAYDKAIAIRKVWPSAHFRTDIAELVEREEGDLK